MIGLPTQLTAYLTDEGKELRAAGYIHVMIHQPDGIEVEVFPFKGVNYRILCTCSPSYPLDPPQVIVAEASHSQAEQWVLLDIRIPLLDQWSANTTLLDLVREVTCLLEKGAYCATDAVLTKPLSQDVVPTILDRAATTPAPPSSFGTEAVTPSSPSIATRDQLVGRFVVRGLVWLLVVTLLLIGIRFAFDTALAQVNRMEAILQNRPTQTVGSTPTEIPGATVVQPEPASQTYIVQRGDTLRSIAKRFYGSEARWPAIRDANNIRNPDRIYPGQKLIIPP